MTEDSEHDHLAQNVVSLRTYMDARHNALQHELHAALQANAIAIAKAEQATEYRLASMNEFRGSMQDQAKRMATKEEVDALRANMQDRLEALRTMHDEKIEALQRITYIGLGAIFVLQFLINAGLFKWGT